VYTLEWARYIADMSPDGIAALQPVLDHVERHRARARAELVAILRSARARELMQDWRLALAQRAPECVDTAPDGGSPIAPIVAARFRKAHRTVIDNGRLIGIASPANDLHELRKDAKRLRYLVECFGSVMPSKPRKSFVRQLKGLQDNLGAHQDAEVHATELGIVAGELATEHATTPTLLAVGQLTERLQHAQRDARAEFAERFAAYDSRETEIIVANLIDTLNSHGD
jgi:CHAD domain-containing protein